MASPAPTTTSGPPGDAFSPSLGPLGYQPVEFLDLPAMRESVPRIRPEVRLRSSADE